MNEHAASPEFISSTATVRVVEDTSRAIVEFGGKVYEAVIGKNGAVAEGEKREGDSKTPIGGPYKILNIYYRKDRMEAPETKAILTELEPDDIWIDDSEDPRYNQPAKSGDIDEGVSYEDLYREDHLYDIIVDLGYNRENVEPGKGSAIFMHLSRDQENPENTPTAGCIAFKKNDLLEILKSVTNDTEIYITVS